MGNKYTKNKSNKNISKISKDYDSIIKNRDAEHSKKKNYLKDFINDNNEIPIMNRLNDLFGKGFRCNKCLSLLRLKINDFKNERGELLIEGKCRKNHIVTKTIKEILKTKGLIKFIDNFKIVDNFYNNRKKDFYDKSLVGIIRFHKDPASKSVFLIKYLTDEEENYYYFVSSYKNEKSFKKENFYICNECKIIYYDEVEEFIHEHPTYKFNYKGNVYDGKSTIYNLEIKSRKKFENKINSQIYYYENLKNIITKNKLETAKEYLDIISDEISLIKEINNNYIEKKSEYNYDNYISIIKNINLTKFDVEKYKNYLTKELILKITELNNKLEINENIIYQNSGPASLSNYKRITLDEGMCDICILNKDYFIITFCKDLLKVYKKEFSVKENKLNLINIFTNESKALINIVKLDDNRIAGTNFSNDSIIYIYSFSNNYTSFKLEKEIILTNIKRFEMIKFKQFLVLNNDEKINFYKEINKNEFQLIISMAFNDIHNILEINDTLFLFIKNSQLFFYNQIKFNKVYKSENLNISKASLLKNNLLGIIKDETLDLELEIMNIKTKEIIFRLNEKYEAEKLFLGMIKVEQMISLNEDNILIAKQIRSGAGGRFYYMTELVEYIKIDDNNYIKGNQIDINRLSPIKINFIGNCFFYFTFDSFKLFYSEFNN